MFFVIPVLAIIAVVFGEPLLPVLVVAALTQQCAAFIFTKEKTYIYAALCLLFAAGSRFVLVAIANAEGSSMPLHGLLNSYVLEFVIWLAAITMLVVTTFNVIYGARTMAQVSEQP